MTKPFILTNHPGAEKSKTWATVSHYSKPEKVSPVSVLNSAVNAIRLFRLRSNFSVVVLGGGAQADMFYLVLQRLWSFHIKPTIKIDCLWYYSNPIWHFFKKRIFRWLDSAVTCYVVWASREMDDYAAAFGLPREKFCFIPYHTTISVNCGEVKQGSYLFSGGNFARDYMTLAQAVDGLELDVVIACTNKDALRGVAFPENVRIVGVSHQEFRRLMLESWINVVSLKKGLLHSGGQQTFLNAMAMGKPVIVTDPEGAKDYICDGVDGLLVPPGDPKSLREAIIKLKEDAECASEMGRNAMAKARDLDTEKHLYALASLARKLS